MDLGASSEPWQTIQASGKGSNDPVGGLSRDLLSDMASELKMTSFETYWRAPS